MSYTKGELVNAALEEIGIASYEFDISAEQMESGLNRLDSMMALWSRQGILLNFPINSKGNSASTDESYVPDSSWEAIITNLAIRLAPSYGRTVSSETRLIARKAYTSLLNDFTRPRERQLRILPRGAGYKSTESRFTDAPQDPYVKDVDEEIDLTGGPVDGS